MRVPRPDDGRLRRGGGSRAGTPRARARRARGLRAGPRGSRRSPSCAARRECRRRRAGTRSRRSPGSASRASAGSAGAGSRGGEPFGGLERSVRMMPDRAVSTKVSLMYAEKRDTDTSPDENLGRWILGGVVVLAVAAGAWFWLKRGPETPEAPAAPPPVAAAARDQEPDRGAGRHRPEPLRDRTGRDAHRHAALRGAVRAGRFREEAGRDGRQPRAFRRRRPHEPGEAAQAASS